MPKQPLFRARAQPMARCFEGWHEPAYRLPCPPRRPLPNGPLPVHLAPPGKRTKRSITGHSVPVCNQTAKAETLRRVYLLRQMPVRDIAAVNRALFIGVPPLVGPGINPRSRSRVG